MSTNLRQDGKTLTYSNSGSAIASGAVVPIVSGTAGFCGVATEDIAATTGVGVLATEGVFEVPAESGTGKSWANGAQIYWDTGDGNANDDASGNTRLGRAWGAKAASATTGLVKLHGS